MADKAASSIPSRPDRRQWLELDARQRLALVERRLATAAAAAA